MSEQANEPGESREQSTILANSAVMAAGTIFSRLSGLIRGILLAAILGASLHGELFQIANTIPNILYIVLAGGIFNAVLVPQLVRSAKEGADGGQAYLNRVMTLAMVFLAVATLALIAAAPLIMDHIYLSADYQSAELKEHRDSAVSLARWCLPQVFFYGMFTLVGQVLNAKGKFGPMMWAPIANNVVAIGALAAYWLVYGVAAGELSRAAYSSKQEMFLGLGATAGIAVQLAILLPYLRAAGVRFSPRWDFRDAGVTHTLKLGLWTAGFVLVNQIALAVVVRLGSAGPAAAEDGTGYAVYSWTYPLMILPHSIVTVSLTTAILPLLSAKAADADLLGMGSTLYQTMRSALVMVLPFAALLPIIAPEVAALMFGWGAANEDRELFVTPIALWGLAVPFFTIHYLSLRGFYAMERTRTVFFIQCLIAATNIGLALWLTSIVEPVNTVPALIVAYALSYGVGSVVSLSLLRATVGRTPSADPAYGARLLACLALAVVTAWGVSALAQWVGPATPGRGWWLVTVAATVCLAGLVYLVAARLLRLREVNEVLTAVFTKVLGRKTAA